MNIIFIITVALIAIAIYVWWVLSPKYIACPSLFSEGELRFLGVLDAAAAPYGLRVFGKVRIADIVQPRGAWLTGGKSKRLWDVTSKHVDYVLCDPKTLTITAVVELDDKSHSRSERKSRDALINQVFKDAKIPIIRVKAASSYNVSEIRDSIASIKNS